MAGHFKSPIMVVRLRKDYIYIWVYKQCNRYETYDTFFFLFSFFVHNDFKIR